jgi:hypothetical protein
LTARIALIKTVCYFANEEEKEAPTI